MSTAFLQRGFGSNAPILLSWLFLAVASGVVSFAGPNVQDASSRTHIERLAVPVADYYAIDWLDDTSWVASSEKDAQTLPSNSSPVYRVSIDSPVAKEISLPVDQELCESTGFVRPARLLDGKIAVIRNCIPYTSWWKRADDLILWDPQTETAEKPFAYSMPHSNLDISLAPVPNGDVIGIVSTHAGLANYMYWLTKDALVQVDLPFERARSPSWSPDGASIVFMGNKTMSSSVNPYWSYAPYDIWTMPADCGQEQGRCAAQARVLAQGVQYANNVQWSPRGDWIVFDGKMGNIRGVWLLNIQRPKELVRVATGYYVAPLWSPDGNRLLVVSSTDPQDSKATCADGCVPYVIDVTAVVGH